MNSAQEIEYFYSAHSAFAYLGSAYLKNIADSARYKIVHKPIDLNQCVIAGGAPGFEQRSRAHVEYYFGCEINRWSEYRNAPVLGFIPTYHAHDSALANGMLIAGLLEGRNIDALAHALLEAHWRDDADLADRETLSQIADNAGYQAVSLIAAANSPAVQKIYADNTAQAIKRSVFGSPTYFVNGEMFYGQDRLEFIERLVNGHK